MYYVDNIIQAGVSGFTLVPYLVNDLTISIAKQGEVSEVKDERVYVPFTLVESLGGSMNADGWASEVPFLSPTLEFPSQAFELSVTAVLEYNPLSVNSNVQLIKNFASTRSEKTHVMVIDRLQALQYWKQQKSTLSLYGVGPKYTGLVLTDFNFKQDEKRKFPIYYAKVDLVFNKLKEDDKGGGTDFVSTSEDARAQEEMSAQENANLTKPDDPLADFL